MEFIDKIADESIATNPDEIRTHMEKVSHPALSMADMSEFSENEEESKPNGPTLEVAPSPSPALKEEVQKEKIVTPAAPDQDWLTSLKDELKNSIVSELKSSLTQDIVSELGKVLKGGTPLVNEESVTPPPIAKEVIKTPPKKDPLKNIKSFPIKRLAAEEPVGLVTLGATKKEGGSRSHTVTLGGANVMPFHFYEGEIPNPPRIAMEVFDSVSPKYPVSLKQKWGELIHNPAQMAKVCVDKYGAELISVNLAGTHPEREDLSAENAVKVVKSVLSAVEVPLIITGHGHYEKNNEIMKAVAAEFAGENLLLNWVEQDNYKTIAGAVLAYNHTIVGQSPIDVNIAKQLNILLKGMGIPENKMVIDPMTGALGYGLEYSYSGMERIRLTGLDGEKMLNLPMVVTPGFECAKMKEMRITETEFPSWGDLHKRAAIWELSTATSLLYAGADLLIMYHPEATLALQKTIKRLMNGES